MTQALRPYAIKQGDYLAKLAYLHGFNAQEIWQHDKNADLRAKRQPDILYPGDILYIPGKRPTGRPIRKGTSNHYRAKVATVALPVRLVHIDGPVANTDCEIRGVPGATGDNPLPARTDADGWLRLTVPTTVAEVEIFVLKLNHTFCVQVGHLNPETSASGLAQRLANMGLHAEGADDTVGAVELALQLFQHKNDMEPTGTADPATIDALRRAHRS